MSEILFNGNAHENAFYSLMKNLNINPGDDERVALLYVLTITEDCRNNFHDCYNQEERCVKKDALQHGWVTGSDARAIRLAFNLFNGAVPTALLESENKTANLYDYRGDFEYNRTELLNSTPCSIFCDGNIGKYLMEGLKMRYRALF